MQNDEDRALFHSSFIVPHSAFVVRGLHVRRWSSRKAGPRSNVPTRSGPSSGRVGSRRGGVRLLRRVWMLAVWMAVAVCVGWGATAAYQEARPLLATWFEVREVTVGGVTKVTHAEVVERMGLQPGETLLSVNAQKLIDRLETHPWIKEAAVSRVLPHTLAVNITERRAVAVLRTPSLTLLLDADARVLSVLNESENPGLPVLVGIDPKAFLLGIAQSREAALTGIRLAGLVGHAFEDRPEVDVSNPENAVAYVKGLRFHFGPSSFEEKWDRYRKIKHALRTSAGVEQGQSTTHCALHPLHETWQRVPVHASPIARSQAMGTRQWVPGNGCQDIDLRYQGKVIVRERG